MKSNTRGIVSGGPAGATGVYVGFLGCVLGASLTAAGPLETTILPPSSASAEGDRFSGIFAYPLRMQEVYHRSLFPPDPIRIMALRFRRDRLVAPVSNVTAQIEVHLSTTAKEPDELATELASNPGTNDTIVFQDAFTATSTATNPGGGPNPFDIEIPLATSFLYRPAQGNLLMEVRTTRGTGTLFVDTADSTEDLASRVFAVTTGSTQAAMADSGADVMEVVYESFAIPLVITSDPVDTNVVEGSATTFTVTATGSGPLRYQWLRDDIPLGEATNRFLILSNVTTTVAGPYFVRVSNNVESVTSAPAILTVRTRPRITEQPQGSAVILGSNATFFVTATGTPPLSYQWFHGDTPLDGATTPSLVLGSVDGEDAGAYTVRVSNPDGFVVSQPAALRIVSSDYTLAAMWGVTGFTLQVAGPAGVSYTVESSLDLKTWNAQATVLDAAAISLIVDPTSLGRPQQFYRIRQL